MMNASFLERFNRYGIGRDASVLIYVVIHSINAWMRIMFQKISYIQTTL
jgi:hypothetical protein